MICKTADFNKKTTIDFNVASIVLDIVRCYPVPR